MEVMQETVAQVQLVEQDKSEVLEVQEGDYRRRHRT
jgi:hypothetical protein